MMFSSFIDYDHVYIDMSALQGVSRALLALLAAIIFVIILVSLDPVHAAPLAILVVVILVSDGASKN
jgi:hypothetical protein